MPTFNLRTETDGIIVSTIYAGDLDRFETAILDEFYSSPVQRYVDEKAARIGHAFWCQEIVGKDEITVLGYPGLVPEEKRKIVRKK